VEPAAPNPPSPSLPYRAVLLALALLAAGLLFEQLVQLILVVMVTIIVALPIAAGATRLQRLGVPRPVGAVLCLLVGLGLIAVVLAFVVPAFVTQVDGFVAQLPAIVTRLERTLDDAFGLKPGTVAATAQRFVKRYTAHPTTLLGPLSSVGETVITLVGSVVIVIISALYAAINPEPLVNGMVRLVPPRHRVHALWVLDRIRLAWLGWLRGIGLDMLVLGGLLYLGMELVGLPFAVGFAVFSALMTVIPNYGSIISAVPPIAYGLAQSLGTGVAVTVVYVVVNQVEGNLALPIIMGRSVSMHPAAVAVGVLIAGALFGALGLVLSIPLISLALILVDELWIKPTQRRDAAAQEALAP
jgi:predicted PurR-regulated permease PerM